MTTDLPMQGMATNYHTTELIDGWQSISGSTTSVTLDEENNSEEDEEEQGSSGGNRKYERKTRRFAWPDDLHRLFVAAIFDLGLKNASPKALLPFMEPTATNAGLTTEHLKSHLQKYRLNYEKSRSEFLAFFDESAKRNGRRRRRTAKSMESHTRFIFPITPTPMNNAPVPETATDAQLRVQQPVLNHPDADASPPPSTYAYSQLMPRTRLDRANLLRLAQQNAAMAFASQLAMGGYSNNTPINEPLPGGDGVPEAQWGMLAIAAAEDGGGGLGF